MPKRKKRLRKGIESLIKQVEIHKKKLEQTRESGNIGLEEYYEKEIISLESVLSRKKETLKKR